MNVSWSPLYIALWMANAAGPEESYLGLQTALPQFFEEEDSFDSPETGLQVARTPENSPARQAGFQPGDVLLRINGQRPRSPQFLDSLIAALPVGSAVTAEVQRGGQILKLSTVTVLRLVPRPTPEVSAFVEKVRLGVVVEGLTAEESRQAGLSPGGGVRVRRFLKASPLIDSDLRPGDVLVGIDGDEIHGGGDFLVLVQELEPDAQVPVEIWRDGERAELKIRTRDPGAHLTSFYFPPLVNYESNAPREETTFGILPFGVLFKYERKENRRTWCFLWFICFSTGTNEELKDLER